MSRPAAGSSPLARGLPRRSSNGSWACRIIPARAGFTPLTGRPGPSRTDHPRSRGVYLLVEGGDLVGERIIPARAGFTSPPGSSSASTTDHPRSRGVYHSGTTASAPAQGSSPLARGLRRRPEGGGRRIGIIPARAGFTRRVSRQLHQDGDHPRSRGVYSASITPNSSADGSSPLARGLPPPSVPRARMTGIIPARAGFTWALLGVPPPGRDHPRSRGVYRRQATAVRRLGGSSPLARGLRFSRIGGCGSCGIIPARAGFTLDEDVRGRRPVDHPRSRGVYPTMTRRAQSRLGSSPLARGLPSAHPVVEALVGIIPARAGFTKSSRRPTTGRRDHPRSRGVYRASARSMAQRTGSSPLARGLPQAGAEGGDRLGIIPARAGFT